MSFTPGPWRDRGNRIVDKDENEVMDCEGCNVWPFKKAEDRQLMVAAPELLEALKVASEILEDELGPTEQLLQPEYIRGIKSAIAKAEGREP